MKDHHAGSLFSSPRLLKHNTTMMNPSTNSGVAPMPCMHVAWNALSPGWFWHDEPTRAVRRFQGFQS